MDTIEFILIIASFGAVLWGDLENVRAGSDGLKGLFALKDDTLKPAAKTRRYRVKHRPLRGKAALHDSREAPAGPATYRDLGDAARMRRRFRRQDEARYRVKDILAKND